MSDNRIITLTTDFGCKDPFVAQMKGVILSINRDAAIVDMTHSIQPQDIDEAAYIIGSSFSYFPSGTIHIGVVDPGVGSRRKALIIEAEGHYFIGPDNGVFSYILNRKGDSVSFSVHHIYEEKYMVSAKSPTFQGRDMFAPVAAWLSKGLEPRKLGSPAKDFVLLPVACAQVARSGISGEVIYIDGFGNAITSIRSDDLTSMGNGYNVEVNNVIIQPVQYYAQTEENSLSCLVNSSGHLELFVKNGHAAKEFGLQKRDKILVYK